MKRSLLIKTAGMVALLIAVLSGVFFVARNNGSDAYIGMKMITREEETALTQGKVAEGTGFGKLMFNGSPAAYDEYENCFYISQRVDTGNWEGKLSGENGEEVCFTEDELISDKKTAVETAHEFKAYTFYGDKYRSFNLIFTGLPTISFKSEENEDEDHLGRISVCDTTGSRQVLAAPFYGYARLHEKKKKDNNFRHINYSLHLKADGEYLRGLDRELFGMREDDDWDLDSVMESEYAINEMAAIRIWNDIVKEDGYQAFQIKAAYTLLFVDNRKSGLYLVRMPYDKKSLALGKKDELEECDSIEETDLSEPDMNEFIDYSIFIETVYAPKNMVKNKYVLRKDMGGGRKTFRLPRHLEYLFNDLPDDLTEYSLNVADSYEKYIVGDAALNEMAEDDPSVKELAGEKYRAFRQGILSDKSLIEILRAETEYLKKCGYYAKSSVEDIDALAPELEAYLTARMENLDKYYENGMEIPAKAAEPSDIGLCFDDKRTSLYVSGNSICFFVPGWALNKELSMDVPEGLGLKIGGREIENGTAVGYAELAQRPQIEVRYGEKSISGTLELLSSDDIGSMFINTASGSMDYILSDISHKESGSMELINADGSTEYQGSFKSLKGHGRSSWVNDLEKKSYNLNFDSGIKLSGLGNTDKYCLISNVYDGSFLRNKITYMLADKGGLKYTPDAVFTDLYINGDYLGVYLLSEKNTVGEGRVDIAALEEDNAEANPGAELKTLPTEQWAGRQGVLMENEPEDISGGYLFEGNLSHHAVTGFFNTDRDYRLEIDYPEYPSTEETEYIYNCFQEAENAIYADNGIDPDSGKNYDECIDTASFAAKYLIDEISKNYDAVKFSAYYYKDRGDDRIYAGPVWDYDIAYGNANVEKDNINSPEGITGLLMGDRFKDNIFSELLKKPQFRAEVEKQYTEVFEPLIKELIEEGIDTEAGKLTGSAAMDDKRYEEYKERTGKGFEEAVGKLKDFMIARKTVMDKEYLVRK